MVDLLVGADAETTKTNISNFEKTFNKMIADGVKKAMGNSTPTAATQSNGISR